MTHAVTIPLLNPNEPEVFLADLNVEEGQKIVAGTLLCTLETTKSTHELEADADGFVVGLRVSAGDTLNAGDTFCYLADTPDWTPPETSSLVSAENTRAPSDLRISTPARQLAEQHNLDLTTLPAGVFITENMVQALLDNSSRLDAPKTAFDPSKIVVYGGGGHGKSVIDLLRVLGMYTIVGVIDDGMHAGETVLGIPVLGGRAVLTDLAEEGVRQAINAVGGIGNVGVRKKVFTNLHEAGFVCPAIIHPTAFVEASAKISPGVQVFPNAYIGSDVVVGYGSIVNTGAIVSHDCQIGVYANISPGAILAGDVGIGSGALIGMGTTLNLGVRVGEYARIGNSATVKDDVPRKGVVRAGTVWPK